MNEIPWIVALFTGALWLATFVIAAALSGWLLLCLQVGAVLAVAVYAWAAGVSWPRRAVVYQYSSW